jgi:Protein of unknown function (DUF1573)/HYDIN/CFA65/VesB-like, Ig-like domain
MLRCSLISVVVFYLARAVTASAAAVIAVDQPTYDFGSISQGKKVEHIFIIRNIGDELIFMNVRPSCGCTAVAISASFIAPGSQGEIKASFDSAEYSGPFEKTVTVDSNDPNSPFILNLKGTIIEELQIVPKHIDLGQVRGDVMQKSHITVTNKGNKPLKLTAIDCTPPQIIAVAEKKLLQPGESGAINVSVVPVKGDRLISGIISIMTDNPANPEVRVSIYGSLSRQPTPYPGSSSDIH